MFNKIKTGAYLGVVLVLALLALQFYCDSRSAERSLREARSAALEEAAHDTGATVAETARPATLEREAEAAVGEAAVERLSRVSTVESVATGQQELASASQADVEIDGQLLVVRERHGRVTVVGEPKDETTAEVTLSQSFKYSIVTFKGEGEAIMLRVVERSPLDGSTLGAHTVPIDQFITAKPPRTSKKFSLNAWGGVFVESDGDTIGVIGGGLYHQSNKHMFRYYSCGLSRHSRGTKAEPYCGAQIGFNF